MRLKGILLLSVVIMLLASCNKDETKPIITILGDNPVTVEVGDVYEDAGATATDNEDGDITDQIETTNGVDVSTAGTYIVSYSVSDEAGNLSIAERIVKLIMTK